MSQKRGRPAPKLNRACMLCGLSVLHFADNDDLVRECTSPTFEGLVATHGDKGSWVARWLRIENFVPGLYAVRVLGKLPDDVRGDLEAQGIEYRPRDGSIQD
ncbi:hypothetical protein KL930_001268 [Ogataea haglerorum]|uniref:Transcription elongation factor SPT4 n=1 Tax=Ogataea haglerorum TaxID=1937702 RepID=A0AAN6I0B0_9ASCO|nr:uncharacterized protein KL911_003669 [Ogataea haglerorum]KAG7694945.1 hypothetical protein KL915_003178 [Ogataea haglerorum]KAG7698490.1 hypothetical protein KL951_001754 [Ogataea haglerorum]KAG7706270.1 hypothetical protein KL914_003165 [Ogataea haglerorum]KAG7708017.1 hypothetical protein KL950_002643 [Ogataea haglerorum]KAG7717185.1 hypothetical protein KL913_002936 [Ogataea haglerorum]